MEQITGFYERVKCMGLKWKELYLIEVLEEMEWNVLDGNGVYKKVFERE